MHASPGWRYEQLIPIQLKIVKKQDLFTASVCVPQVVEQARERLPLPIVPASVSNLHTQTHFDDFTTAFSILRN
jgi:hypothetical protein